MSGQRCARIGTPLRNGAANDALWRENRADALSIPGDALMRVGIPLEVKEGERRVALEPEAVAALAADGHRVDVAQGAGSGVGLADDAYRAAGARVVEPAQAWEAELVVKVKEIQASEVDGLTRGQAIFGFHQLGNDAALTRELAARGVTAIAYEMVRGADGRYPLLEPMSAIAGNLAIAIAAQVLGEDAGSVLVLGAGPAGIEAARVAAYAGARVTLLTRTRASLERARDAVGVPVDLGIVSPAALDYHVPRVDLVVGAAAIPGAPTPKLLSRALVARMRRGAMIVDISIDGGGVAETSRMTSHADPTYVEEGVIHYCVPNMPAADPRRATHALSRAVLPFARELAAKGIARAVRENAALAAGVLLWRGRVTHAAIAEHAGLAYTALSMAQTA
jgi:alanine dehydrogenase